MVNGWIIISHHSLRWTLSFADFTLQDIKERRRWEDDRAPKMYHSSDAMPLGSSTAIDSCINCMLYRDILKFHRFMIAGMRGCGVGRSVRECLSLPADRFLVGPPPTQCFPLVSWQDWTWQALWMALFCEKLPLYKCLLSLVYIHCPKEIVPLVFAEFVC